MKHWNTSPHKFAVHNWEHWTFWTKNHELVNFLGCFGSDSCWRRSLKICPAPWPFYIHCLWRPKRAAGCMNQISESSDLIFDESRRISISFCTQAWTWHLSFCKDNSNKRNSKTSMGYQMSRILSSTPIYVLHSHSEWVWESAVGDPDPWNEANIFARIQTVMNSSLLGFSNLVVVLNPWDFSCNRTHTQVGPQWSLYLY